MYNKNLCKIALQEAAKKSFVEILEMEVEPEHLHMVVEIPLTKTCVDAIQDLKSFSARILFRLMPKLRYRYPRKKLWSRGKFAISVGNITLEKAKEYVKNRETHHAKANLRHIVGILARAVARVSPQTEGLPRGGGQINLHH